MGPSGAAELSANTRRAYRTGQRNWRSWASGRGLPEFPARPGDLQRWLAALAAQGKRPDTLRTYHAAVAHWHRGLTGPNPARDPEVLRLLDSLARQAAAQGRANEGPDPLRWSQIRQIADTAHQPRRNQPGGRLETATRARRRGGIEIALIAVAHDASLRCSQILALRWKDVDAPQHDGLGQIHVPHPTAAQPATAPISEFTDQALARIRPPDADPGQRVFDFSANTATRRIKAAAGAAGIDPANITASSPALGMAQDLAAYRAEMLDLVQTSR
ncbi:site-specific integrase [Candidatus Poriferisocius sp.]|uniref:site-specific integrase n=1 Tax=Candidatus Poriferisocius sp. TaxID=3101276 RepID=UPI003B02CD83